MRKVEFLLAVGAILFVATSMTGPFATKYIVDPGAVEDAVPTVGLDIPHQLPNPKFITGSVTLRESEFGSETVSANTGGGCLIYRIPKFRECIGDSWCPPLGAGSLSSPNTVEGYCAYESDVPELIMMGKVKKVCWYKPNPDSCFRSRTDPLPLNEPKKFNQTPIHPPGTNGRIYWRVVSCQNLMVGGCANLTPNGFVYKFGNIRKFD